MQTIEETADVMFKGQHRMNLQNMIMTYREIRNIVDGISQKNINSIQTTATHSYNFSGQHTDIAYASVDGGLNVNVINSIEDNELRNNVMKIYSEALNDGYLSFDEKNKIFNLTEKGQQHVNSVAFMQQFEKDQKRSLAEKSAKVTLKGNKSDLNIFRYTDELNLNKIICSPQDYKNIAEYFRFCEKYGWVTISDNGIVIPTEKCITYLSKHKAESFSVTKLTAENVKNVTENISKQVVKNSAKAAASAASAGTATAVDVIIQLSQKGAELLKKATDLNTKRSAQNNCH